MTVDEVKSLQDRHPVAWGAIRINEIIFTKTRLAWCLPWSFTKNPVIFSRDAPGSEHQLLPGQLYAVREHLRVLGHALVSDIGLLFLPVLIYDCLKKNLNTRKTEFDV